MSAYEADPLLCEAMGLDLSRAYVALRKDEMARWEASGNEFSTDNVTDWELTQYLPFY